MATILKGGKLLLTTNNYSLTTTCIISIIDPKMSKMSIIHETLKLKLRKTLLRCNVLKRFFVFRLIRIIDIISIIGPKMSKMLIIHKSLSERFYPLTL